MNFYAKIKQKLNNKKFKKYHKEKRNKIFLKPKTSIFKRRKKTKFSNFKINFNLKDLSLKEYYDKYYNKKNNNYNYYFFVGFILIILSIYSFFFSDYFNIKNIPITSEDELTNINLGYKAVDDFRFTSIFFISKTNIEKKLKDYQNNISEVKIKRLFPNTLRIYLKSYKALFNTNIDGNNYNILTNGSLVPSKKNKKLLMLDIFDKELNYKGILDYKIIFKKSYINLINILQISILNNIEKIYIEKIRYFVLEREAHIVLRNKTILIFSLDDNIKEQLSLLLLFYTNNNKKLDNIYYLDLRNSKKLIFCPKSNAKKCKQNLKNIYNFEEKIPVPKKVISKNKTNNEKEKRKKKKFPKIKLIDN